MAGKVFGVIMAVIVAVALADLVTHPQGTSGLTAAGVSLEKTALNAELGKTS
jgi:hypothetical protein